MKITIAHARRVCYCVPGMKLFAKKYNIDFKEFAKNGIDEEVFIQTGDSMAIDIVEEAHKWEAQRNKR